MVEREKNMHKILDLAEMAIMPNDYSAVPMGKFLSIVTDFCTMITFLNGKQETVLRLSYTFINLQNLKTYEFE